MRTLWLSVDPYMRWAIRGARTNVGEVVTAEVVGEVAATASPAVAVGQIVVGRIGWQAYGLWRLTNCASSIRRSPLSKPVSAFWECPGSRPISDCSRLAGRRPGETVLVSGAAGAVGSAVGQIAAIKDVAWWALPVPRPSAAT